MAAKITVTGQVQEIRKVKSPNDPNTYWTCLEIVTGGSPSAPKGLPDPSKDIQFTILMNSKQFSKLQESSAEANLSVKGSKILVQGELILDLSYEILAGDIGIISFQSENLDATKVKPDIVEGIKKEENVNNMGKSKASFDEAFKEIAVGAEKPKNKQPNSPMKICSIQIPPEFKERNPREEKILKAVQYYELHGEFDSEILLIKSEEGWVLKDGYTRYLAAKRLGLDEIAVTLFEESENK